MQTALDGILRYLIGTGRLSVRWPDGRLTLYSGDDGPSAGIVIRTNNAVRRLTLNPALALGEAYMDGSVTPDGCNIYDILDVMSANLGHNNERQPVMRLRTFLRQLKRRLDQYNPAARAQRNVAHHYDLNGRLYSLFLDRDRQYSCAYFPRGDETLEEAQLAKKRHIAAKLCLDRPDLRILDIGCGWGGLALTLARDYGARITGITLSREQLSEARHRAIAEGLEDRVNFELMDYRAVNQKFDRIVSVGMFEHVGIGHYQTFCDMVARSLTPDGIALIHAIGRSDGPSCTNAWIDKYIFPGGYSPALSEVLPAVERSGLVATDIEILRLHYAQTLRQWRWRFNANRDTIASIYDERFCRMFEFYLCGSELAFRRGGHMVFQIQLGARQDAVPLTRDYLYAGAGRIGVSSPVSL
ncbi:MAG: cyclopropane-fatty-acyl-phospholipid synthase family protein [Acetobacteraceae bacterium]|jgi:cyclopropane-fatty-acyl-phospholipid synthase